MFYKFFLPPVDFWASVRFHDDMEHQPGPAGGSWGCGDARAFIYSSSAPVRLPALPLGRQTP